MKTKMTKEQCQSSHSWAPKGYMASPLPSFEHYSGMKCVRFAQTLVLCRRVHVYPQQQPQVQGRWGR
jgi:hypothetical protein